MIGQTNITKFPSLKYLKAGLVGCKIEGAKKLEHGIKEVV